MRVKSKVLRPSNSTRKCRSRKNIVQIRAIKKIKALMKKAHL